MLALAGEAATAIVLPCSAMLVVPSLLAVVAGRGRWPVAAGVVAGLVVGAFLTMGWAPRPPAVASGLAIAGGLLATAAPGRRAVAGVGAGVAGLAAGLAWQPCVGEQLGRVLTTGVRAPGSAALPLAVYVAVLAGPALLVALLAASRWGGALRASVVRRGAVTLGVALGATVAVGLGDDLTGWLFRVSAPLV